MPTGRGTTGIGWWREPGGSESPDYWFAISYEWPDLEPHDMDFKESVEKLLKMPPGKIDTADSEIGSPACS